MGVDHPSYHFYCSHGRISFVLYLPAELQLLELIRSARNEMGRTENHINLFTSDKFWISCQNTLLYSVICLFFETFFGVSIAVFLNRKFRAMDIFRTMSLLPIVATPVAVSMVWKMIYDPALGILAQILSLFGIAPIAWLGNSDIALAAPMVVDIWEFTPQIMLICLVGLNGIPTDCLEAASIDGASRW